MVPTFDMRAVPRHVSMKVISHVTIKQTKMYQTT